MSICFLTSRLQKSVIPCASLLCKTSSISLIQHRTVKQRKGTLKKVQHAPAYHEVRKSFVMDKEGELRYPNWYQPLPQGGRVPGGMWYQHPEEDHSELPRQHYLTAGEWLSEHDKLKRNEWPWIKGIRSRLPEHYKQRFMERFSVDPIPVHWRPAKKWRQDEFGVVHRVGNRALPIFFPRVRNEGLWGGEGIVQGLRKRKDNPMKENSPKVWFPHLVKRVLHSEILQMHMAIVCTHRTLDLVDEAMGFDNYVLQTHEVDLQSRLGMVLKQKMMYKIMTLDKDNELHKKYSKHLIPEEEIDWLGLDMTEAERKQRSIEDKVTSSRIKPLKEQFATELVEKLLNPEDDEEVEEEESFLKKLNPFKDKAGAD